MAVKPIIIPIQADTSGIQIGIDAIDALGGVDEATAKKFAQSNKAFADQNKIIAASSPEIAKLTAAISALTESIVGGALTQKLTQIGVASNKAGALSAAAAPEVNQLTASLEGLSQVQEVSAVNNELKGTAIVAEQAAESASVLHASFNSFTNDAEKIDFATLSVVELEGALDDLIKKETQLKTAAASTLNPELIAKYGEGLQAVTADINTVSQLLDQANASKFLDNTPVSQYDKAIGALRTQLKGLKADTPEFNDVSKELHASELAAAGFAKQATSLRSQLRQYRETLAAMEEAGLENTATFQKMAVAAGQLEDQMGDTQTRIKALASDSFAFDAAIQGAQGVTAAFSIAQGASALLGTEDEQLQKTLLKVNAATAILSGLQQIQNTLQAQSAVVIGVTVVQQRAAAAAIALQTAAESRNVIIRYAAIVAQKLLNAVMAANPIGLLVVAIAALATGLLALTSGTEDAKVATENLNTELENQNTVLEANAQAYKRNAELLAAQAQQAGALESQLSIIQQNARRREAQDLAANIKYNQTKLKSEQLNGDQIIALNKQIQDDTAKLNDLNNQGQIAALQIQQQIQDESFRSATSAAKARIAQTQSNTDANTKAQIDAIKIGQQQQLAAENLTAGERQEIIAENEEKIRQLTLDGVKRRYDDQIALAQARSLDARNEYRRLESDIEVVLLTAERDRLDKSKDQQILITSQANEAIRQLRLKLNKDLETIDISQRARDREGRLLTSKERLQDEVLDGAKAAAERLQRAQDESAARIQIERDLQLQLKSVRERLQNDSIEAASNIAGSLVQISQNQSDAEIAILDEQLQKGLISQNAYNAQVKQIRIRAAQQEKQLALFQATIAASLAVLAVLKDQTIPIALRPIFIALAVAQAAAQIAAIQSKPIPAFAKGTNSAPGGDALVGEAGGELIYQNGSWSYAGEPTIMKLKKGAKVVPAKETARIFEMYSIPKPYLNQGLPIPTNNIKIDYNKIGRAVGGELSKMPVQLFGIDERGFTRRTISMADRNKFLKKRFGR